MTVCSGAAGLMDLRLRFTAWAVCPEEDEAVSFRFGLPTFLCSPTSQQALLRVHRMHLRSSGCKRWHFALAFLQSSHETRRCDGCSSISLIVGSEATAKVKLLQVCHCRRLRRFC